MILNLSGLRFGQLDISVSDPLIPLIGVLWPFLALRDALLAS